MEWQVILALVLVIPIILFPAAFIWYLNVGGIYHAVQEARKRKAAPEHEEGKARASAIIGRRAKPSVLAIGRPMRFVLPVIVPVGAYAFLIWFFLGNFGWQFALALALVLPIVLFVPVLVWAAVVSGLYQVVRDTLRRRATAPRRRRAVTTAEEPVIREVT